MKNTAAALILSLSSFGFVSCGVTASTPDSEPGAHSGARPQQEAHEGAQEVAPEGSQGTPRSAEGTQAQSKKAPLDGEIVTDVNGNGIDDVYDITDGTSLDENLNGIPDEVEAMFPDQQ